MAIEVTYGDGIRAATGLVVACGLEADMSVRQEHRNGPGKRVDRGQVLHPVSVEIAHGDGCTIATDREGPSGLENSIAIAEEHEYRVALIVAHGQIKFPIAVEVAQSNRQRVAASRKRPLRDKRHILSMCCRGEYHATNR